MKKTYILIAAILMVANISLTAQVAITTDGSSADNSAMFEVKSTNKGFLPPRMTESQKNTITSPVAGLIIWCSDCGTIGELQVYNGTAWVSISSGTSASDVSVANPGTMSGIYYSGVAFSNVTATFVISNNGLTTVGPINFDNAVSIGGGTATFSVAATATASTDYSSITINAGANQTLVYDIAGTPSSMGTLVINFDATGGLSSSVTANITSGSATFDLPKTKLWASISDIFTGSISDGETVDIEYTEAAGNYTAWTSPSYDIIDNSSTTRTITLSNTAGDYSSSGSITYTINITDGGGAIDVPQQVVGASFTMATIDIQVNGISEGNLLLDADGGYLDPEYGTAGHNYVYLSVDNPETGKTWLNNNLGAAYSNEDDANFNINQQATSSTDANAYGDLYQWGRYSDGHEARTSDITYTHATTAVPNQGNDWDGKFIEGSSDWLTTQDDNLWQGESGTNNPCPSGYRLPTQTEWAAEKESWSSNNSAGAYASPLKLPMAGIRYNSSGSLDYVGSRGFYWSSTVEGTSSISLTFRESFANIGHIDRAYGHSVRCIKD